MADRYPTSIRLDDRHEDYLDGRPIQLSPLIRALLDMYIDGEIPEEKLEERLRETKR